MIRDAPFPICELQGMRLSRVTQEALLDFVFEHLRRGEGGWIVTANLDFLRRYANEPSLRALYDEADLRVADGAPLVWAARLQGDPLPERVAGSDMVWHLAARAVPEKRSLFLLGGKEESNARVTAILNRHAGGDAVCGSLSPFIASPPTAEEIEHIADALSSARPDIVLVAMGTPKQEQLIRALRPKLPSAWMMGVGASLAFVAGDVRRAPVWMQRVGLEWVHRLAQEPRRLTRRYVIEDLPFAGRLFAGVLARRVGAGGRAPNKR